MIYRDPSNRPTRVGGNVGANRGAPPDLRFPRGRRARTGGGRVECPMYGTEPDIPDALSVRKGFFARRRHLVPAAAIELIDGTSGVVGLRVERESLRSFL